MEWKSEKLGNNINTFLFNLNFFGIFTGFPVGTRGVQF